jgi:hypothetical protein
MRTRTQLSAPRVVGRAPANPASAERMLAIHVYEEQADTARRGSSGPGS